MPKVKYGKNQKVVEVAQGANLFHALNDLGVPVASSCGGEGVCVKCMVKVIEGKENLSPEGDLETDMKEIHDVPPGHRMSCQTEVNGDITIDTDYW